jgi:hypothetical protein
MLITLALECDAMLVSVAMTFLSSPSLVCVALVLTIVDPLVFLQSQEVGLSLSSIQVLDPFRLISVIVSHLTQAACPGYVSFVLALPAQHFPRLPPFSWQRFSSTAFALKVFCENCCALFFATSKENPISTASANVVFCIEL